MNKIIFIQGLFFLVVFFGTYYFGGRAICSHVISSTTDKYVGTFKVLDGCTFTRKIKETK